MKRRSAWRRLVGVPAAMVALALVTAACGDDDDASSDGTAAAGATTDAAATTTAGGTESTAGSATTVGSATTAGATTTAASAAEGASDPASADRSATFTYANPGGVNQWDPHRVVNAIDAIFMRQVYDRVLSFNQTPTTVELAPQLATSWEVADDGMSITFELRDDVMFQDGTKFDAAAFKANMDRAMGPDSTVGQRDLSNVASVDVVDPTHVVFQLKQPDPSIPWALAFGSTGMMASPAAFDTLATEPVGSGPFKLVSWAKDADVVYERWDDYWDPDAALLAGLTIRTITDANARFNSVRSGELDCAIMSSPTDVQSRELAEDGFQWLQSFSPNTYGIALNANLPPLDNVQVRRALYLALNREEISAELLQDLQPPVYQTFNTGFLGHDDALDQEVFDAEAARSLVTEAGAEGASLKVIQTQTSPQDQLALVFQQAAADIGLNVELVPISTAEARAEYAKGGYHGLSTVLIGQPEPSQTLNQSYLGGTNLAPPPPELVAMATEGLNLPVDSPERESKYQEISAYLVENPIHLPIAQFVTVNLCQENVTGTNNIIDIGRIDFRGVGITA